jgi:hypothetical protein
LAVRKCTGPEGTQWYPRTGSVAAVKVCERKSTWGHSLETSPGDLLDPVSLARAFAGIEVACYRMHNPPQTLPGRLHGQPNRREPRKEGRRLGRCSDQRTFGERTGERAARACTANATGPITHPRAVLFCGQTLPTRRNQSSLGLDHRRDVRDEQDDWEDASVWFGNSRRIEMSLGECSAGSGLQITLETRRRVLVRELDHHVHAPRAQLVGMSADACVVVGDPRAWIRRQADVVVRRVSDGPEDVDESPLRVHAVTTAKSTLYATQLSSRHSNDGSLMLQMLRRQGGSRRAVWSMGNGQPPPLRRSHA